MEAAHIPDPLQITLAYSADRTNGIVGGCGCFWMSGGMAEANMSFLPYGMSAVARLTGEYGSNINSTNQNLGLVSYLFGPRYTWQNRSKSRPFAQFLIGGTHGFDATFPSANGPSPINPDAFSFATGGGINLNLSHHLALRIVEGDYLQTHLPNDAGNRQNHLQLVSGIVFRIPPHR